MELKVYTKDGSATSRSVTLDEAVFGIEPSDHAIWLDVRSIQAASRQGTHKSKERGEVRGGGSKPWRQKGTGRARVGTIRSPIWSGGGRAFGPRPHKYRVAVNRKTKQLARKSALTYKAQSDAIRVLENFSFDQPKTRDMAAILQALELDGRKVLLMTSGYDLNIYKSGRNLPKLSIIDAASASTLDLLQAEIVIMQEGALETITGILSGATTPESVAGAEPKVED